MGRLHVFTPEKYMLTYGPNAPALRVKAGDSVRVKTVDAGGRDEHGRRVPPSKLQSRDAMQLLSQAGRARIGNVCDPNYSVVYKVRKSLFT